ncbi:unannotated protein [freshwater metagenome]|uniref:Unannotated protein n=1 Tax=freshwater metagenome TaxID=449393 RepID=A0A6J6Z4L3_9ZZZZ
MGDIDHAHERGDLANHGVNHTDELIGVPIIRKKRDGVVSQTHALPTYPDSPKKPDLWTQAPPFSG